MEQKKSRFRNVIRVVIFLLAAAALTMMFVDDLRRDENDPPAAQLLPDLASYRQVEGQTITAYVSALSEGAALLAGQPHLAATVGALDQVIGCYQDIGGVRARVYSHVDWPLDAGLVAVIDESTLNDPENLFRCVTPATLNLEGVDEIVIEPCTAAYTLNREDGAFHIIYAASSYAVCRDFCASLDQCVAHFDSLP